MTPPEVEGEPEWFIELELPSALSPAQVAAIREAHAPYRELGIAALREALVGTTVLQLGPYWPPGRAAEALDRLRAVGLSGEVRAR